MLILTRYPLIIQLFYLTKIVAETARRDLVPALLVFIGADVSALTGDLAAICIEGTVYQCALSMWLTALGTRLT